VLVAAHSHQLNAAVLFTLSKCTNTPKCGDVNVKFKTRKGGNCKA